MIYDKCMNVISRRQFADMLVETRIRPAIIRDLRFVPEELHDWDDRDFLAVTNRSRSEGVLVAPFERTYVVAFRLQKRNANNSGRVEAIICDICATWQRGSNSAIISFIRGDKSSVSFLCCADLACSLHVRDKTAAAVLSRMQLRENTTVEKRIKRLHVRLEAILHRL